MARELTEDCKWCWALPGLPCLVAGEYTPTIVPHSGLSEGIGAFPYQKYGPPSKRTPLGQPCPHCHVDAGVPCWKSAAYQDNEGFHPCRRPGYDTWCTNADDHPKFPKDVAPESERHLEPTFTFTNEYALHAWSAYRSPNIIIGEDSGFGFSQLLDRGTNELEKLYDDTEALMTAMARAGRFLNTRFEAAAVKKMLAGQREHGEGTWRSVDLWRYAADEPLDIRNYVALLVERGQMTPHDANLIVQKAEDILTLLEDAKGGPIL